jgi:hypothetical protein
MAWNFQSQIRAFALFSRLDDVDRQIVEFLGRELKGDANVPVGQGVTLAEVWTARPVAVSSLPPLRPQGVARD